MVDYLRSHAGFSWIGLVFLAMLFVPNILWARNTPPEFDTLSSAEPAWLVILERVGQALACVTVLCTRSLRPERFSVHTFWLIAAGTLMIIYELFWIRYFFVSRTVDMFYAPIAGIPVPGAVLPVAALICLAVYAGSPLMAAAACILGVGHIGIHARHAISLRM